jgi:two-component sensor histidine kinase
LVSSAVMEADRPKSAPTCAQDKPAEANCSTTAILESISDGLTTFDREWRYTYVNAAAAKMLRKAPEELLAKNCWEMWPRMEFSPIGDGYRRALARNLPVQLEAFHPEPLNRWFEFRCYPGREGLSVLFTDIHERKQSELRLLEVNQFLDRRVEALEVALQQKNVLLKEVQHRVKNNLQVISSLLSLEAARFADPTLEKVLKESRDRVRSMALVHEKFSHSDDMAQIDFRDYVESLGRYLMSSYPSDSNAIEWRADVDVTLGIDDAIPCGLILQELLSNSIKHAFPSGEGQISIEFHRSNDELQLVYRDSGVGLPSGIDLLNPSSLGLQLVSDLAHQLYAQVHYDCASGSTFTFRFKPAKTRYPKTLTSSGRWSESRPRAGSDSEQKNT